MPDQPAEDRPERSEPVGAPGHELGRRDRRRPLKAAYDLEAVPDGVACRRAGRVEPGRQADPAGLACDEVRISCTYGMLLCLTRPLRAAYLLGDVLGMPDTTGAEICAITPAAFRQRLARARRTIRHVIDNRCGLVNPANPCRCGRQIQAGLDVGYLDRANLPLAQHPRTAGDVAARQRLDALADQIDVAVAIGELYRADRFAAPAQVWQHLRQACPDLMEAGASP